MDPLAVMTYCRACEMSFESIPAGFLQVFKLLQSPKKFAIGAVLSAMSSLSSIAFAGACLSFDLDTSPDKRMKNPEFYGFIRSEPTTRALTFLNLFALGFVNAAMKIGGMSLLALTSGIWTASYMVLDFGSFFLYKAWRGDLRSALRVPGALSWISSILENTCFKLVSKPPNPTLPRDPEPQTITKPTPETKHLELTPPPSSIFFFSSGTGQVCCT